MQVVVVSHDPIWASKFDSESQVVARALAPIFVAIHHIGSTSIPGIHAKPIIDMLAEVTAIDEVDKQNSAMTVLGYEAMGEFGILGRRYFRKDNDTGVREYQVHVFASSSPDVDRHIAFRDFLRVKPDLAKRYSELKRRLAIEYPNDIDAYIDGKNSFIEDTERRALEWWRSA